MSDEGSEAKGRGVPGSVRWAAAFFGLLVLGMVSYYVRTKRFETARPLSEQSVPTARAPGTMQAGPPPPVNSQGSDEEVAASLARRDESRQRILTQRDAASPTRIDGPRSRLPEAELEQLRSIARDASLRAYDRIAAWKQLQQNQATSPEVTSCLIELLLTSKEEQVRGDVCQNLRDDNSAPVKKALIQCLQQDPSPRVREEAALTLGTYPGDRTVKEALEWAAQNDLSEAVKGVARQGLLRY